MRLYGSVSAGLGRCGYTLNAGPFCDESAAESSLRANTVLHKLTLPFPLPFTNFKTPECHLLKKTIFHEILRLSGEPSSCRRCELFVDSKRGYLLSTSTFDLTAKLIIHGQHVTHTSRQLVGRTMIDVRKSRPCHLSRILPVRRSMESIYRLQIRYRIKTFGDLKPSAQRN